MSLVLCINTHALHLMRNRLSRWFKAIFTIVGFYITVHLFVVFTGTHHDVHNYVDESTSGRSELREPAFVDGEPKFVIILAYQRSGSTLFGQMFNANPGAFYVFEPLDALYSSLYGTSFGWNAPSDIISFANGSERVPPDFELEAVNSFLGRLLSCDVDRLPIEFLGHNFCMLFPDQFAASHDYIGCRNASKLSTFYCHEHTMDYCGRRLAAVTPERQQDCHRRLASAASEVHEAIQQKMSHPANGFHRRIERNDVSVDDDVGQIFAMHKKCLKHFRQRMQRSGCRAVLTAVCEGGGSHGPRKRIRAVKLVRGTMDGIAPLLNSLPNLRIVHLVRDPRAVVFSRTNFDSSASSLHSLGYRDPADIMVAEARIYCRQAAADLRAAREIEQRLPGRILTVRYEDFVVEPARWTVSVYRFLNETPPTETVARMWALAVEGQRNMAARELAERWQKHLTFDVATRIAKQCSELLDFAERNVVEHH